MNWSNNSLSDPDYIIVGTVHDDTARTARLNSVDVSSINDIYVLKLQKYPVFSRF